MFNGNGYQANSYNENDVHRLSSVVEGEDPIAQAMGMQQPQQNIHQQQQNLAHGAFYPASEQGLINPSKFNPLGVKLGHQSQQINANGKAISIAISPDGTITISIGG